MTSSRFSMLMTSVLLVYALVMYTVAWWTMRPLDLGNTLIFLVPTVSHAVHAVLVNGNGKEKI